MMIEIVMTVVSIAMTGLSSYLVYVAQTSYKSRKGNDKAMKILMRRELRELHDEHMEKGHITDEALGEFLEIYEIYHELGGNGRGTVWKNDVEKLERRQ